MLLISLYEHILMLLYFAACCLKNKLMRPGLESRLLYEKGVPGFWASEPHMQYKWRAKPSSLILVFGNIEITKGTALQPCLF